MLRKKKNIQNIVDQSPVEKQQIHISRAGVAVDGKPMQHRDPHAAAMW